MKFRIVMTLAAIAVLVGVWAAKGTTEEPATPAQATKPAADEGLQGFKIP